MIRWTSRHGEAGIFLCIMDPLQTPLLLFVFVLFCLICLNSPKYNRMARHDRGCTMKEEEAKKQNSNKNKEDNSYTSTTIKMV